MANKNLKTALRARKAAERSAARLKKMHFSQVESEEKLDRFTQRKVDRLNKIVESAERAEQRRLEKQAQEKAEEAEALAIMEWQRQRMMAKQQRRR